MPVTAPAYPVNLLVAGRRVLVVGGGAVAAEKAAGLLAAGALVHVVALSVSDAVRDLDVEVEERAFRPGDLAGHWLAVACTDDPATNQAVFDEGEATGVWVNAADDPERCSYTLPARHRQGRVLVTVSTSGDSPALATWLRDRIGADLGPEVDDLRQLLADARSELASQDRRATPADWRSALDSGMLDLVRAGRLDAARELLRATLAPVDPVSPDPRGQE